MKTLPEFRHALNHEVDARCREKRMVKNPYRAPETISGVESSQVQAVIDVLAERLYALEMSVEKLKRKKTP